jgi:hypothetical protein
MRKRKEIEDELDLTKKALTDQNNFLSKKKIEIDLRDLSIKHI